MNTHAETLMMSRRAYGVPEEMTTAILGVETGYGRRTGRFAVLEALVTLAFRYPPRSKLFRQELEQFLLLSREENIRPQRIKGSYAGAMGIAQFMPTSYRLYAVDFDGDGKRDLSKNIPDANRKCCQLLQGTRLAAKGTHRHARERRRRRESRSFGLFAGSSSHAGTVGGDGRRARPRVFRSRRRPH